ncbi:unnamed protein product [Protopolystoma xenopodis]|uniref:Uncharacterized protein n=1 Tax=Protopolystoma xenopodis TaxID=117903 RepID=A0A448XE20_9PLAT|nr:unnamed protein product [Protopolystoma xenopodis]
MRMVMNRKTFSASVRRDSAETSPNLASMAVGLMSARCMIYLMGTAAIGRSGGLTEPEARRKCLPLVDPLPSHQLPRQPDLHLTLA